jgi:hypothetical protein
MDKSGEERELVVNVDYEFFVSALVVMSLVNWAYILFLHPDSAQAEVLWIMNAGLSIFLLLDFVMRVWRQPHRRRFLGRGGGWIILLGSLPLPFAGILRVLWLWLAARRLRSSDYRQMRNIVVQHRAQSTLLGAVLAAVVVLETGALLVLKMENTASGANIRTGIDSLWWSIVTLSTVGYGDKYPVTTPGRVVGVIMIIVGVGLFSALTSFLAQWFLKARAAGSQPQPPSSGEIQQLDRLSALLRTYYVQQLLADTRRSPAEVLAELREKASEICEIHTKTG